MELNRIVVHIKIFKCRLYPLIYIIYIAESLNLNYSQKRDDFIRKFYYSARILCSYRRHQSSFLFIVLFKIEASLFHYFEAEVIFIQT